MICNADTFQEEGACTAKKAINDLPERPLEHFMGVSARA